MKAKEINNVDPELKRLLTECISDKGLTEVVKATGVQRNQLKMYLNGVSSITLTTVSKLSTYLIKNGY